MQYKTFKECSISALGFGTMRLPLQDGGKGDPVCRNTDIDMETAEEMFDFAVRSGINYFDTAYDYHGGAAAELTGKVLSKYPRETYFIADKFPGYAVANFGHHEEIFARQLERARSSYIDFYLMHNVLENNIDPYLDSSIGTVEYFIRKREEGAVRHLGFSCHGSPETMERFLRKYGKEMEFCQIQLNWLDWKFQRADEKVALLRSYGLPIWVMEPLRGGTLINLSEEERKPLRTLSPDRTDAEWAFRFLRTIPEVRVILSGMSNSEQIRENIRIFESAEGLTQPEWDALLALGEKKTAERTVPCTGCRYCEHACPMELPVSTIIRNYNDYIYTGGGVIIPRVINALPEEKRPTACIGCRTCEGVCPQSIRISEVLRDFAEKLK